MICTPKETVKRTGQFSTLQKTLSDVRESNMRLQEKLNVVQLEVKALKNKYGVVDEKKEEK